MTRSVLVLNHFAVPRGQAGGTRHVELFSRLEGWRHLIIASHLNHLTGEPQEPEPGFMPVKVLGYKVNGWRRIRSEEHTSELQSLMRISYAVFCLKKKTKNTNR